MTLVYEDPPRLLGSDPASDPSSPKPQTFRVTRFRRILDSISSESVIVAIIAFATYFTVAMLLDFKYHSFDGDSISRMANGFYILHSRDPHLAAVGFVWNPLSSFADLPLLAFNSFWPVLASHNVAGTTVSAFAMAGAVHQLHSILKEWRVGMAPRLLLTALFAFNPMVLLFGGNGMSEALYLFTMISATRYLLRWIRNNELPSLVYSAIALAFAYLERSEPVAAAGLGSLLIVSITYLRSDGGTRKRMFAGLTDATIFVMPIFTTFVGWATISWVITGQPFQQFTSKYGNAALIAASHTRPAPMSTRLVHEVLAVTYMAPLFAVIAIASLLVALLRRNLQVLGVIAVVGGGLMFTLVSYLGNAIFPWFRYYIMLAPLEVLLVGSMFAVPSTLRESKSTGRESKSTGLASASSVHQRRSKATTIGAGLVAVAVSLTLLGPSIPSTAMAMDNANIAPDSLLTIGYIIHHHLNAEDVAAKNAYTGVQSIANYFNAPKFAIGDVVVDTADNCIPNVITNVSRPRVFVIHNDRDFQRVLDNPLVFHAHYLLVQQGKGNSTDAVGLQYPNLGHGATWATLAHVFPAKGYCVDFRLYRVTGYPTGNF